MWETKTKALSFYEFKKLAAQDASLAVITSYSIHYTKLYDVRQVLRPIYNGVDEPWHSFYLIETDGIFQSDKEAAAYVDKDGNRIQPNAVAGDLKFIDKNGDGVINDEDRLFMGSATPEMTYGFNALV